MRRGTALALACWAVTACEAPPVLPPALCDESPAALRPSPRPIEATSLRVEQTIDRAGFEAFAGRLFGPASQGGDRHQDTELSPGLLLSVAADTRTPSQVAVSLEMMPIGQSSEERRLVTRVPASYTLGQGFIDAVVAAFAQSERVVAGGDVMAPWTLEYRARSANGGAFTLGVDSAAGRTVLFVTTASPETSLLPGNVNTPAKVGEPFETVAGTVWFRLSRDEFDFFSRRAYGVSAGAEQNFRDFMLHPHDWLRLTVTPQYALGVVDVGFEVVTVDGRRVALAKAPASYVAGEQFQANVLRLIDTMQAQEQALPGSSTTWTAPFIYTDPEGGGVVEVRAQGKGGVFEIAYAVESPVSLLQDVDFVPFLGHVELPSGPPAPAVCGEASADATGRFVVTFSASSTVMGSRNLDGPLVGDVRGSVFRSSDVTLLGPNDGAESVADFFFADVDVRDPTLLRAFDIDATLPFGDYQILGFMDIDGNATEDSGPDAFDPVMIPIGGYALNCGVQPINVEFAILLPEDF